jgi:hypothetical protein
MCTAMSQLRSAHPTPSSCTFDVPSPAACLFFLYIMCYIYIRKIVLYIYCLHAVLIYPVLIHILGPALPCLQLYFISLAYTKPTLIVRTICGTLASITMASMIIMLPSALRLRPQTLISLTLSTRKRYERSSICYYL